MTPQRFALFHLTREPAVQVADPAPLLLLLHGIGSNEGDLMALAPYLDRRFFVVGARAPIAMGPDAYGWYHTDFTPERRIIDSSEPVRSRNVILRFIEELIEAYHLDAMGVYIMGFSQGAIMTLGVALSRPDLLAGAVVMSGRPLPELVSRTADRKSLTGLPILVVHGTEDPVLPVENGRRVKKLLETLPVNLTYREYPMGHQVATESLGDVAAWLTARLDERERLV